MPPKSNRYGSKPVDSTNLTISIVHPDLQFALQDPQIQLNLCQFKRLLHMLNNACLKTKLALSPKLRQSCEAWENASILDSLVKSPGEMEEFENDLIGLEGHEQPPLPSKDDATRERQAVTTAMKKIFFTSDLKNQIWELKDRGAECFLTHLQNILDQDHTCADATFREECISALRRLALQANILPASLLLKEVTIDDETNPEASGGGGTIYKGKWKNIQVAVKYLHIHSSSMGDRLDARRQIRREMLLMRQLRHPNILPVLGIVEKQYRDGLVSNWMPHGTIMEFLKEHPDISKLEMLSQVAKGLKHIHEHRPPVIHGDLKGSNIFINANDDGTYKAVIGDFGLSHMKYSITRTKITTVISGGSTPWMAPELISENDGDPTFQSDVYSFGMLIHEVMTGRPPYEEIKSPGGLTRAIIGGKRPISEISGDLRKLMVQCWNGKPQDRPDIGTVENEITRILGQSDIIETIALVPTSLVDHIVTSRNEPAFQNVKLEVLQGSVERKGIKYSNIAIKGNVLAAQKAKACLEENVEIFRETSTTIDMKVDRRFYGSIIGEKGFSLKRLIKKHSVKITIPPKGSTSDMIKIEGQPESVDAAKQDIREIVTRGKRSHSSVRLPVSPLTARIVKERRDQIIPFLRDVTVDIEGGVITMRGFGNTLERAEKAIRAIQAEAASKKIVNVILDDHLCELIEKDEKFLEDIKRRCLDSEEVVEATLSSNSLELIGSLKSVALLQKELREIKSLGHRYVLGERISEKRHSSLLAKEEKLIEKIRQDAHVMVYFPCSGGYGNHDMPRNMASLTGESHKEIVKVVGSTEEACKRGCNFLKDRVEKLKEKEKEAPISYLFPACLNDIVRRQVDPMFKTLGVSVTECSQENSTIPHPILSFLSDDPELAVSSGKRWKINRAPSWSSGETLPMCRWQLNARSPQAIDEAVKELTEVVPNTWRYVGVVDLSSIRQVKSIRELCATSDAGDNITCDIIQEGMRGRLIIGASSRKARKELESFIEKVTLLIENLE